MATLAIAASLVVVGTGPAQAVGVINVPADKPTIQAAIDAASAGDTVVVAAGTYHERIDFKGKAIEVRSASGPATTTIDGDATGIVAVFKSGETRASVLRGFTITDGLIPPPAPAPDLPGAGVAINNSSPTVVGNVVTGNHAPGNLGGGIGVSTGAPLIQDNVVTGNVSNYDGGGIMASGGAEVVGNRIEDNVAGSGAGLAVFAGATVIRDNVIRGNAAGSRHGGGVTMVGNGGQFVDNLVVGNTADLRGGGVYWYSGQDVRDAVVLHNTIVDNEAPQGSAIAGVRDGTTTVGNIMVGSAATSLVDCGDDPLQMLVFTRNDVYNGTATSPFSGCGGDPGSWAGNMSADPLFVAPGATPADYRLQTGSPAIDAGDATLAPLPATDLNGSPRITDGDGDGEAVVDLGAYEAPEKVLVRARYHPLDPARILDTRSGLAAPAAPRGPGSTLNLQVTGQGGVPATGVSAVVLNVTVIGPTKTSFLTAWPAGVSRPVAANLNFVAGQTVPNLVMVKVGDGGRVNLYNYAGSTHVVADVAGWYGELGEKTGSRYTGLVPTRILDTRTGNGTPAGRLGPTSSLDLQVTGRGGVPAEGVTAVVLSVAVTGPTATSFLTAWPTGSPLPAAANLRYVAGQTVSNLVVVKVGTHGVVSLWNQSGSTHVTADVAGWFGPGGAPGAAGYTSLVPARILDTRYGVGGTSVGPGATLGLQVTGRGGVPATGVSSVALNVTATQPTATSFLTAWPTGVPRPLAANLNYVAGLTVPNLVVVKVGDGGKVNLFNSSGSTHLVADVAGWFSE